MEVFINGEDILKKLKKTWHQCQKWQFKNIIIWIILNSFLY